MIKNLLLVALRNFRRDRWYSLLNVLGLTIGITFSIFLIFYVRDELSYDLDNVHADKIYRINSYIKEAGKDEMKWAATQFPLGPVLQKDFPEVAIATRFVGDDRKMYKKGENHSYVDKVFFADSTVFNIFTYSFIEGNPNSALVEPKSIVLTESVAKKFFGKTSGIVGQTLQNADNELYTVRAVIRDVPSNSHIRFNMLISVSTLPKGFSDSWGSFGFFTYVLLRPNADPAAFEKKLLPMYEKYMAPIFRQFNIKIHYTVFPITQIHLHSPVSEPEEMGSMSYIYIFSAVALFMILIACINYMNLTTARSARRAKEIGIRKVTGSTRPQLVTQFLVESTLTTVVALLLSMGLVALLLPTFNALSGKSLSFHMLLTPAFLLILVGIILVVGLLGGSYPALYLSSFNPIMVLKGSLAKGSSNVTLRRILVVTQFSIAMIMLICTWVVYSQLRYLQNQDLGFNKQEVLNIRATGDGDIRTQIGAFKNEVRKNPQVLSVSSSQAVPGDGISFNLYSFQNDKGGYTDQGVSNYGIDEDFFGTLGMKVVKGRGFTGLGDTLHSVVVNENLVKYFHWQNPVGMHIRFSGDTSKRYFEVVGVVKDFNQQSLYNEITPLLLFYRPNARSIQVKLNAKDIPTTLTSVEKNWKFIFPNIPFQYTFLDQDFNSQYAADQKRGKIFTAFSILTILITCLGLLGLIAFTTEQRQKEISIRKIMGAGTGRIITLMTSNFVLLVGISCFIAFPVAWLFMHNWLKVFQYRMDLSPTPFVLSALTVLAITMLTVIFHTVRAALANPSKGLRTE